MTTIADLARTLETWAPRETAQSYDNVGLQVGDPAREVSRVLLALDLTPDVLDEAIREETDLIVTHHPLLFRPLTHLTPRSFVSSLALRLAENRIGYYAIHTNLDAAPAGVSFALAERLGLRDAAFLDVLPVEIQPGHPVGLGAVGHLPTPKSLETFLDRVCERLDTPALRYAGHLDQPVRRVAVCGGSGSSLIEKALEAGADAFVTADVTYHTYFDVFDPSGTPRMALIDPGHYETEVLTETLLHDWLAARFSTVTFQYTRHTTNPTRIFVRPSTGG